MKFFTKYNIKKALLATMWIAVGCGTVALLVAAVRTKDIKHCKGIDITIHGVSNNFFIDETDVKNIISSYTGDIEGTRITSFNLVAMEAELKRDVWIKSAELYFDNNGVLKVNVEEREPIARIFTVEGSSFYIDNMNMMLPVSEKLSARLPVFTSFPSENKVLSKADSALLNDVKKISILIQADSFLMAMIEQVDIVPGHEFEMIPKMGDQTIVFGNVANAEQKFKKLELFYKKVMLKYGWSRYSMINLRYKGQVIGKLRGKDDMSADSLRTQEIMRAIAMNAAMAANDSLQMMILDNEKNTTDLSIIERSMEREDEDEEMSPLTKRLAEAAETTAAMPAAKPIVAKKAVIKAAGKPIVKPAAIKTSKTAVKPLAVKQVKKIPTSVKTVPVKQQSKPKAVMQKPNDY